MERIENEEKRIVGLWGLICFYGLVPRSERQDSKGVATNGDGFDAFRGCATSHSPEGKHTRNRFSFVSLTFSAHLNPQLGRLGFKLSLWVNFSSYGNSSFLVSLYYDWDDLTDDWMICFILAIKNYSSVHDCLLWILSWICNDGSDLDVVYGRSFIWEW